MPFILGGIALIGLAAWAYSAWQSQQTQTAAAATTSTMAAGGLPPGGPANTTVSTPNAQGYSAVIGAQATGGSSAPPKSGG